MHNILINIIYIYSYRLAVFLKMPVFFGKNPAHVIRPGIVFFPYIHRLSCGLTGFISFTRPDPQPKRPDIEKMESLCATLETVEAPSETHSGKIKTPIRFMDENICSRLLETVTRCKTRPQFYAIYADILIQDRLKQIADRIGTIIKKAEVNLAQRAGRLTLNEVKRISRGMETVKDAKSGLETELLKNIEKINGLTDTGMLPDERSVFVLRQINSVLNSIDRIEVRGRDSAGISLFFHLDEDAGATFLTMLENLLVPEELDARLNQALLLNRSISIRNHVTKKNRQITSVAIVYKVAKEIGYLGENIKNIREYIRSDPVFQAVITLPCVEFSTIAHTRWASVGEISEANCHPIDNRTPSSCADAGIIHVCLNGDIDNFQALKATHEQAGTNFDEAITCDTKIIPVHIQSYLDQGYDIVESFRLAVNDFEGSHAISMQTDLAPGKIFLALKGSGQSIFIGIGPNGYMPASEVYGFVEETQAFIKMEGERHVPGKTNNRQGQICILEPSGRRGTAGITAISYDGSKILLSDNEIKKTRITTRDIDRHDFPHFFLKEISESPESVKKTIEGRWLTADRDGLQYEIALDASTVPGPMESAFKKGKIKRIFFIGQGTAGVAALACANIMLHYLDSPELDIRAMKSSELSGMVTNKDCHKDMEDTLIIPISQSGTTTDTNRTVEIMKNLGAWSIAIVNRRDSELSFKTDGVFYTSSGRDIEMSVASTKAFYAQIIAGAMMGLYFAGISGRRPPGFISNEIKEILGIPSCMKRVLDLSDRIAASAKRLALKREYWATVGSGPNRAAADEIRIKLSELCYKTISSDYVEDKKHIDLSSEPLIIICAAGTRRNILGDIVKDTAIFQSHKAITVVMADENDDRFDPYADDVFHVPHVPEHFAPLINTLAGHLWGYFAALTINEGSIFLSRFREELSETIEEFVSKKLDIYEIATEKDFREKLAIFYTKFRKRQSAGTIPSTIGIIGATDIILLLKYLSGRLPASDFELDFGVRGTAKNMIAELFSTLSMSINTMSRPIDAIKHQAKTVTVGTSRIEEKTEGLIFNAIKKNGFSTDRVTIANVMVIRNIQKIISSIKGLTLYHISGINLLGEPTDAAAIEVVKKEGSSAAMTSRSETDRILKGTKRIIVREGNVYIGRGRRDKRSILVIPIIANEPERPNIIDYLLLFEISFKKDLSINDRVTALGGKHERIKNLVQESNIIWKDEYLDLIQTEDLFGISAEKIADRIVSQIGNCSA